MSSPPAIAYDPSGTALLSPQSHAGFFVAGQAPTREQLALEAARLAYYRAEASEAQLQRLAADLGRGGFGAPQLLFDAATGSYGFAALQAQGEGALIAFRGTQPDHLRDIATDLKALPVPWPERGGQVHAGFAAAARALLPAAQDWLAGPAAGRGTLLLCGHSLGAAIATLAASVLAPQWLVTIGSPRVGDAEFVRALDGVAIQRLVNGCDLVTQLPPALALYAHAGPATYLPCDDAQAVVIDPSEDFVDADRREGRLRYAAEQAGKPGALPLRELADHAPVNYLRRYW